MTTEQFYEKIGGDYKGVMGRFMTEERVLRFVRKFPADGSYDALIAALKSNACQEAFRAAHTIKGVAQNLGFTALYEIAANVTDILRNGNMEVHALMPELTRLYRLTVDSIAELD